MASMTDLQTPPQSNDAERAVLGSVLIKQESLYQVVDKLVPEYFYADKHVRIFAAMLSLHGDGEAIDIVTLSQKLKDQSLLEAIGGDSYLAGLTTTVPSAANIEHYALIVLGKHIDRELIDAGGEISKVGFQADGNMEVKLDLAEQTLSQIAGKLNSSDMHALRDVASQAVKRYEALRKDKGALRGVSSGFASLDNKLSGFQNSDLIILAARPSVGKTSLALDIARKAAVDGKTRVAFFSLEMSKDQLVDRMIAAEARVDAWRLRTGSLREASDVQAVEDAVGRLKHAEIHIDDSSSNNVLRIKSACRKLKREGLDLVIVDYLQLMAPMSLGGKTSMVQEVTEISRGLKQLAKELHVPVIALSQLSRNVEHRGENAEPHLADLRDSGSIEQDADVVMFIHRAKCDDDAKRRSAETKLIIEKHRNGATGVVHLFFDDEKSSFMELDKHQDPAEFEDFVDIS